MPTASQLSNAYSAEYYGQGKDKFGGTIEKILDAFKRQRANRLDRRMEGPGKILDIGCGNGRFLSFMRDLGHQIYGLEMVGASADRAGEIAGLQLKLGHLEADDFSLNTFDAITLYHVFEHLTEPKKYLKIISDILKPGGYLVMSFPNIDSFQSRLFKGNWFHLDPPRHLFFFKPKDFRSEMSKYGLDTINERHFSIEYNPYGWQQSILNLLCKKRDVLYEHMKHNEAYVKDYPAVNLSLQSLWYKASAPIFIGLDLFDAVMRKSGTVELLLRKSF